MMMHIISYRDRRGGEESASERVEFVARRADNGAKFGCVDPDRVGDGGSEELELRVLCEYIVGDDAGRRREESKDSDSGKITKKGLMTRTGLVFKR